MIRPVEWIQREWFWLIGSAVTLAGGFYAAEGGTNGFTVAVGVIAFLLVVIAGLVRPKLTPHIVVLFTVFDRDLHLSGPVPLTTLTIVLLLLIPGFLKMIMTSKAVPRFAWFGSGMLVLGLIAASLASDHPELAWPGLLRWLPVLIMVLGFTSLFLSHKGSGRQLTIAVVIGGAVAGIFGILQRSGRYWLVGPPYAPGVTDSTFGYYTNFANFEAIATVLGVGLVVASIRARRFPLVIMGFTLLCLYMVVTSYSRGAVGLVAVGLLVILLKEVASPVRFIIAVAGLTLMGLVVQVAPAGYVADIVAKFTVSQNGDIVRAQLQSGGMEVLAHSPLGIGFNNFSALVASGDIYSTLALAHAHNTFIQMGLDAGWLGGVGFIVLVVRAFWRAFWTKGSAVAVGFGAALTGYLVQVSQDYFFFEEASLVAFGLLLAGSLSGSREVRSVGGATPRISDRGILDVSEQVGPAQARRIQPRRLVKLSLAYRDSLGESRTEGVNNQDAAKLTLVEESARLSP